MNEQKLIKFCMLIPKGIGHCFSYFLVAMTMSEADNYGCFWQFFPLQNIYTKRDMHIRKEKNSTETQTELLETVSKLQHICSRAPTSSKALKTYSFYKSHCFSLRTLMSSCSQTVSSQFSIKKDKIFIKQKHRDHALVTEKACDSCIPLMFGKSWNVEKPHEHRLSANTCQTQYILWPVRNELMSVCIISVHDTQERQVDKLPNLF